MERFNISYSIIIPDNVPNSQCADMNTVFEIIGRDKRFFSMGTINIFQDIEKQILSLESLITAKKICAIKLFPGHDLFFLTIKNINPYINYVLQHDIPVVFHTGASAGDTDCTKYNDPKYLVEIAKKYRTLKIVISHFFWPKMKYCYDITKDLKNIYYDTSAMADDEVIKCSGGWNKVIKLLKKTVILKPENVLFGTDWPMCPVDKHIKLIKDLQFNPKTEKKIFFLNAANLYKLEIL